MNLCMKWKKIEHREQICGCQGEGDWVRNGVGGWG